MSHSGQDAALRAITEQEKKGTRKMIQLTQNRVAASRSLAPGLLLVVLMAAWLALAASPAHAATYMVDRNDDPDPTTAKACTDAPNDCSLRGGRWSLPTPPPGPTP